MSVENTDPELKFLSYGAIVQVDTTQCACSVNNFEFCASQAEQPKICGHGGGAWRPPDRFRPTNFTGFRHLRLIMAHYGRNFGPEAHRFSSNWIYSPLLLTLLCRMNGAVLYRLQLSKRALLHQ